MLRRRPRILSILLGLGALASSSACSSRREEKAAAPAASSAGELTLPPEQRARISVAVVRPSTFRRPIEATGTVAFDQNTSTQVVAGISGPIARVLVPLGARVSPGDELAELTSPDFAAAVSSYRKAVAAAANLRRIADLDKRLFEAGGIPRRDEQQAETDAVSAEADRDAALAQLRSIGLPSAAIRDLQQGKPVPGVRGVVRSPIAGTVVERLVTPGQLVVAGSTPCFTVADLSTVWVMASVFERDIASARPGDPAEILPDDADPLPGRVDYISALVDPATRAISVRVVARNPGGVLRKDQYVRVKIESRREIRGLLAPASAILRDDENLPFLFVEQADGSFARRRVDLGPRVDGGYQVLAGLREGERIIQEGGLFLQFAQSQ